MALGGGTAAADEIDPVPGPREMCRRPLRRHFPFPRDGSHTEGKKYVNLRKCLIL